MASWFPWPKRPKQGAFPEDVQAMMREIEEANRQHVEAAARSEAARKAVEDRIRRLTGDDLLPGGRDAAD